MNRRNELSTHNEEKEWYVVNDWYDIQKLLK